MMKIDQDQTILVEQFILTDLIPVTAAVACTLLSNRLTLQLGLDMLKRGGGNQSQISEVIHKQILSFKSQLT